MLVKMRYSVGYVFGILYIRRWVQKFLFIAFTIQSYDKQTLAYLWHAEVLSIQHTGKNCETCLFCKVYEFTVDVDMIIRQDARHIFEDKKV